MPNFLTYFVPSRVEFRDLRYSRFGSARISIICCRTNHVIVPATTGRRYDWLEDRRDATPKYNLQRSDAATPYPSDRRAAASHDRRTGQTCRPSRRCNAEIPSTPPEAENVTDLFTCGQLSISEGRGGRRQRAGTSWRSQPQIECVPNVTITTSANEAPLPSCCCSHGRVAVQGFDDPCRTGSGTSQLSFSQLGRSAPPLLAHAAAVFVYGIVETLNGNWAMLYLSGERGVSTQGAWIRARRLLGDGDGGTRTYCSDLPACPGALDLRGAPCPVADGVSARRTRGERSGRDRRFRPRRARVLGISAVEHQLRGRRVPTCRP